MHVRSTAALLIAAAALLAGCGEGPETTTAAARDSTTDTTKTGSMRTSPHPVDVPTNLTVTASMKTEMRDTAQALARTQDGAQDTELVGPVKGSTYYAGWGEYEYAMGSFDQRKYPIPEGDATGGWYRAAPDGEWVAFDFGMYGDVTPICHYPRKLRDIWFPQFGDSPCGSPRGGRVMFSDVAARSRCVSARRTESITCGYFARRADPFTTTSGQLLPDGFGAQGIRVELETYADERLPYGIPTEITAGSKTYTCTAEPEAMRCALGDGAALTVGSDGVQLG